MDQENAIVTDAQVEDQIQEDSSRNNEPPPPAAKDPRIAAMDAIEDRLYREAGLDVEKEVAVKEEEGEEQTKSEPTRDEKGRFKAADESAEPEPKYKVKIEGEEQELPLGEILKGFQKDQTASRRLEEAAQARKQLEAERAAFEEEKAKLTSPAATQNEKVAPSDDVKSAAQHLYKSMFLGTEEEGVTALTEFLAGQRASRNETPIPVEQVANQAAEKVRMQVQYELAEKAFKDKHEFAKDPELYRMTLAHVRETAAESSTYDEAFEKAAARTIGWMDERAKAFGLVKKVDAPAHTDKTAEARKQSLDTVKPASARVPAPAEEKEESIQEIIAEMRKKRGLPV